MDFKKLTSSPTPKTSPKALVTLSYKILAGMEINFQGHMINPLRSDDIPKLFTWHKQKSSSLLPDHPLGGLGGDEFLDSINENVQKPNPEAVHVRLDHTETLIGIAGFTNIKWDDLNAKTYFFLDPEKSDNPALFGRYCSIILHLLMRCAFITLKLDKISIETAGSEIMLAHTIEASGFRREAEFKEYAVLNGRNVSMIYASCTKEDYFRVFPN